MPEENLFSVFFQAILIFYRVIFCSQIFIFAIFHKSSPTQIHFEVHILSTTEMYNRTITKSPSLYRSIFIYITIFATVLIVIIIIFRIIESAWKATIYQDMQILNLRVSIWNCNIFHIYKMQQWNIFKLYCKILIVSFFENVHEINCYYK